MARKKTDFLINTGEELLVLEQQFSSKEEMEKRMEVYAKMTELAKEEQEDEGNQL